MTPAHIIVLPGGGYHRHAEHEGGKVAGWLRGLGLESSVFLYPIKTRHPGPLDAVRAEVRRVRDAGAERVGLIGFSAGGHAAAMAALAPATTPDEAGGIPDLAILGYPVVSMLLPTHQGSRENLIGLDASPELRAETSADLLVGVDAPPFFVWHTAEDAAVPVQHSYLLGMALAAAQVPHELHVYEKGRHGIGMAVGEGTAETWTAACEAWLRQAGWVA